MHTNFAGARWICLALRGGIHCALSHSVDWVTTSAAELAFSVNSTEIYMCRVCAVNAQDSAVLMMAPGREVCGLPSMRWLYEDCASARTNAM